MKIKSIKNTILVGKNGTAISSVTKDEVKQQEIAFKRIDKNGRFEDDTSKLTKGIVELLEEITRKVKKGDH